MGNVTIDQVDVGSGLNISDLTTSKLQGSGVFDVLLETARVQLDDQYNKQRIRGPEYAEAYIAMFQATLQAATAFALAKERQALELKGLELQNDLVQAQIDQVRDQMQKTPYEIAQIKASTDQTEAQTANIAKDTELKDYQLTELYPAQLANAEKQLDLLSAQIDVQKEQLELLKEQVSQAEAQTAYYQQKVITEEAQTDPSVIKSGSVIASQIALMQGQLDGYKRNAEQAVLQVMANTWNVRRQTDEDTSANSTNLFDDATIGKMVQQAFAGVDLVVTPA